MVIGTLIFIIRYSNLNIESDAIFSRDFPTWRGAAIFTLYIWVLGFNLFCFEKYKISHRLIFKFNDHHFSNSTYLFRLAGLFTMLFMVTFLIYLLQIAKIINRIESFRPEYIVSIMWVSLFTYMFMPLPIFNHEGRLYAAKLMIKTIISPIVGVEFGIVWMTDQWLSLITPFRDLRYTICYYTELKFDVPSINPCKNNNSFEIVVLIATIAISYRILQCIRLGISQGKYFTAPHFTNSIKYSLSLASAIMSFQYNLDSSSQAFFVMWILVSCISTCVSHYWDLKHDWDLLYFDEKNFLLRKYLTFQPKALYYIVMCTNFLMRLSWMVTLSPNIATLFGNANLLTFATGSIEIIRRGVWNLFRV